MSRIFLAGAAGAIGRRLTPLLLGHGHSVWGATRSPDNREFLRKLGARPVVVDVFDAEALATAVLEAKPEIVIHQLTDLSRIHDPTRRSDALARNARIRDEGTRNLVAAARKAGARRLIAQSIAWAYAPGPRPYREDYPLDLNAEGDRVVSVRGVASLERQVLGASPVEGLALRYGRLYGPGSGADTAPSPPSLHVDAAACAALLAIDHGEPAIFNVAEPSGEAATDKATAVLGWCADFGWIEPEPRHCRRRHDFPPRCRKTAGSSVSALSAAPNAAHLRGENHAVPVDDPLGREGDAVGA